MTSDPIEFLRARQAENRQAIAEHKRILISLYEDAVRKFEAVYGAGPCRGVRRASRLPRGVAPVTSYPDRKTSGPCIRRSAGDEPIDRACPDCGHTNVVHPNPGNPALSACALCELEQLRRELTP